MNAHTQGPRVTKRAGGPYWWADGGLVSADNPMGQFRVLTSEYGTRFLHSEEALGARLIQLSDAAATEPGPTQ